MFKKILFTFLAIKIFASQPEPFALFTVPKSGSHLLIKTLYYMTGFTPYWHTDPPATKQLFQQSHFPYTHCCLSPRLLNYYANSSIKQIIGIRDLRDVAVSIVYQIRKGLWPEFTHNPRKKEEFLRLSFDEQLLFVIQQEYKLAPPEILLQLEIQKVAKQAELLVQNPSVFICRYEDLVGPQGGGTSESQKQLLQKIGLHIGLYFSPEQIEELSLCCYGNEYNPFGHGDFSNYQSTFREGKIGSWRNSFKEVHKEAFKKKLGRALITLGYEKDDTW